MGAPEYTRFDDVKELWTPEQPFEKYWDGIQTWLTKSENIRDSFITVSS